MTNQKQGETPPKVAQEKEVIPTTSESYRSPVDSNIHKSGVVQTNAKSSAVAEPGSSAQMTEEADSQGTEKR